MLTILKKTLAFLLAALVKKAVDYLLSWLLDGL